MVFIFISTPQELGRNFTGTWVTPLRFVVTVLLQNSSEVPFLRLNSFWVRFLTQAEQLLHKFTNCRYEISFPAHKDSILETFSIQVSVRSEGQCSCTTFFCSYWTCQSGSFGLRDYLNQVYLERFSLFCVVSIGPIRSPYGFDWCHSHFCMMQSNQSSSVSPYLNGSFGPANTTIISLTAADPFNRQGTWFGFGFGKFMWFLPNKQWFSTTLSLYTTFWCWFLITNSCHRNWWSWRSIQRGRYNNHCF